MDIEARLVALENSVEKINQRLTELEKKAAAATTAGDIKEEYSVLLLGQLSDDELRRFSLGPYSKKSTPGSVSL